MSVTATRATAMTFLEWDRPIDELDPEERPVRRYIRERAAAPPPLAGLTREQLEHELAFGATAMGQVLARAELVRRGALPPALDRSRPAGPLRKACPSRS